MMTSVSGRREPRRMTEDLPLYSQGMKCIHFRGERSSERQRGRKATGAPSP